MGCHGYVCRLKHGCFCFVVHPLMCLHHGNKWSIDQKRTAHIEKEMSAGIHITLLANCGVLQRDQAVR